VPSIRGIKEVRPCTLWHAYIDDYRGQHWSPSPFRISGETAFFTQYEDCRRTQLGPLQTRADVDLLVHEVGFRLMFSDPALYSMALIGCSFELCIGESRFWQWNAGMHVGVDPYALPKDDPLVADEIGLVLDGCCLEQRGFCSFLPLQRVLSVSQREKFEVRMKSDMVIVEALQKHYEAQTPGSYAEICLYLNCLETREVL
jgi:hypothetical protein